MDSGTVLDISSSIVWEHTHTQGYYYNRSGDFSEILTRGISQCVVMQHRPHPDILIQNLFYTSLEAGQVGVNSDHSKELE